MVAAGLLLLSPGSTAGDWEIDAGRENFLHVDLIAPTDIVTSGGTLAIDVLVTDKFGLPVADATVYIYAGRGSTSQQRLLTGSDGRAQFTYTAVSPTELRDVIEVHVIKSGYAYTPNSEFELGVSVIPPPTRKVIPAAPAVGVSLGAVVAVAVVGTEAGRLGVFNLFLFPLYSRLRREEVLDHFVRGQIYGYIQSHPGEHYNKVRDDLRITNGTLSHHLRTLEMQGFVKSKRDGIYRRFYPVDMTIPQDTGMRRSDLQIRLLDHLQRTADGISQADLALLLGVSQQTISYNLQVLGRDGIVRAVRAGRQKRYYVMEGLDA